jgi:hypothetical protein
MHKNILPDSLSGPDGRAKRRSSCGRWDRKDARAVDAITTCIVDLPTAILLRRDRLSSSTARAHLHAAVRAVLAVGPPPRSPVSNEREQQWIHRPA